MISCDEIIVSKDTYREQASEIQSKRIDDIPLLLSPFGTMGTRKNRQPSHALCQTPQGFHPVR
jgi:hypothetical protein